MKAVVTMSGGVDSSVAAAILKDRGYDITGAAMRMWDEEAFPEQEKGYGCYGPGEEANIEDARRVAEALDIPFYDFDLTNEYRTEVLDYFSREYRAGRTPNPCLRCNRRVKFGALLDKIRKSGIEFDYFASGHYARTGYDENSGRYLLRKSKDEKKDQTYFISSLTQEQLSRLLLPVGDYTKTEVRDMAADLNLPTRDKPESMDFIAGGYAPYIGAAQPGPILDRHNNVLGEHRGIPFYTIGQRKGIGLQNERPLYVIEIDPESNSITVGASEEAFSDEFTASEMNWIAVENLEETISAKVKIRNVHTAADAEVTPLEGDRISVRFEKPQRAITPGQAAVIYIDDTVLGSGTIERRRK